MSRRVWDGSLSPGLRPHGLTSVHGRSQEKKRVPGSPGSRAQFIAGSALLVGTRSCRCGRSLARGHPALSRSTEAQSRHVIGGRVLSKQASMKQELASMSTALTGALVSVLRRAWGNIRSRSCTCPRSLTVVAGDSESPIPSHAVACGAYDACARGSWPLLGGATLHAMEPEAREMGEGRLRRAGSGAPARGACSREEPLNS